MCDAFDPGVEVGNRGCDGCQLTFAACGSGTVATDKWIVDAVVVARVACSRVWWVVVTVVVVVGWSVAVEEQSSPGEGFANHPRRWKASCGVVPGWGRLGPKELGDKWMHWSVGSEPA